MAQSQKQRKVERDRVYLKEQVGLVTKHTVMVEIMATAKVTNNKLESHVESNKNYLPNMYQI